MQRTERSIQGLMSLTSDTARKLVDGQEQMVPIAQLQIGDRVLIKPGELVPTDGIVTEGFSELDRSSITGESIPVETTVGDEVFAGTINGHGVLKIQIDRSPESSLIQRVIRLVERDLKQPLLNNLSNASSAAMPKRSSCWAFCWVLYHHFSSVGLGKRQSIAP